MRLLLLHDRKDNFHLVDTTTYDGRRYTMCGLCYKGDIVSLLALDNAISNVCRDCYEEYVVDQDYCSWCLRFPMRYHANETLLGPNPRRLPVKFEYGEVFDRDWEKLRRYKKLLKRKPKIEG